jgi:hypothetical protein
MKTRIQKWGNSLALRIPKSFAVETGLDQDAIVDVALVYAVSGVLTVIFPLLFALTPLGHAERYMPVGDARVGDALSMEDN